MGFNIDVQRSERTNRQGALEIAIRSGEIVFTRLFRARDNEPDDYIVAPPTQLAFWLTDNWWRLRWECFPAGGMTADWRLAHDLSSIGGGYAWPRLSIWGEDNRIGLLSRSDPEGVMGPVRYLTDSLDFVWANDFEQTCDRFLDNAIDEYTADSADRAALQAQVRALREERDDPSFALWRRMEARLGFDPDDAPERTVEDLIQLGGRFGQDDIDEAATAMPGAASAATLESEIDAARASRLACNFTNALAGYPGGVRPAYQVTEAFTLRSDARSRSPWELAEYTANAVRSAFGRPEGPLRNANLAELLGTSGDPFHANMAQTVSGLPYGLRLSVDGASQTRLVLRSRWPHDRRFEAARALGDAIWTGGSALGPIAASRTPRQKFQRAFAQSLLCPYDDLIAYIGTEDPVEGDVAAAARHFHVSERMVRTVLVNKHIWNRKKLVPYAAPSNEALEELVDAA
jgi:hypothetical protein